MLQRLSCPWCDDDESRGVYFLKILSSKVVFSIGVWKLLISEKEDSMKISVVVLAQIKLERHFALFTIQVRTSSDIISSECLSIGLVSSQHFAGGKDPPRRKQIQNLWKKTAAMNKSMESSPETLRLGSFLTFKFDQRDWNWNILPQQNRLFWACEERFQRENLKVCCEFVGLRRSARERSPAIAEVWCTCLTTLWTNKSSSQARHSMCNMGCFLQLESKSLIATGRGTNIDIKDSDGSSLIPWRFCYNGHFFCSFA